MNSKAIIAILAVVVIVAAGATAVVLANNNKSDDDFTLILGTIEDTGPISTTSSSFYEQRRMIVQEPLMGFAMNGGYENLTAESCTTSDKITWTVKLKSDVVWSDGEKYTADDIKHTVDIYAIGRPAVVSNIESVTVVDETTLTMVLKAASELGGVVSNMPILPWHIWKDYNIATADDYQKVSDKNAFIGTGPYKVDSLNDTKDELTYVFNDKFRQDAPHVTKIIFKHYGQEDAMVAALLAGEIDAIYNYGTPGVSAAYLDKIKESKDVDYLNVVTGGIPADILFNMRSSISADDNLRNAVKYGIDYDQIIKYVAPATGVVGNAGLVPSTIDGYIDTEKLGQDSTKAEDYMKAYFAAHGLVWGTDKVTVDVLVWSNSDADRFTNIFNLMKEQLAKINITLNPLTVPAADFAATARDPSTEMVLWFMTDAAIKNYAGFATHYVSSTGTLKFVYGTEADNADYEKIVTDMNAATTDAAKKECGKQFQEFYEANAVAIPVYWGGYIQPYSNDYKGWACSPASGLLCYENLFGLEKA